MRYKDDEVPFYWEAEIRPVLPTINYKTNPCKLICVFSQQAQKQAYAVVLL